MIVVTSQMSQVELIGRQGSELRYVYSIRKTVFNDELRFPKRDRQVYNEWDALSNHYLLIHNGVPSGVVSVVDWSGLTDILESQSINPNLKVAKVTKLAILPHARNTNNIRELIEKVKAELTHYDFVTAHVSTPSDDFNNTRQFSMGEKYKRLFGLKDIKEMHNEFGAPTKILGMYTPHILQ